MCGARYHGPLKIWAHRRPHPLENDDAVGCTTSQEKDDSISKLTSTVDEACAG